jgi:hypothetical protein
MSTPLAYNTAADHTVNVMNIGRWGARVLTFNIKHINFTKYDAVECTENEN